VIAKKVLAAVNDEVALNASESLAGTVVFHLDNVTGVINVVFEARMRGSPTWQLIQAANVSTGTLVTVATAAGLFRIDASGQLDIRARSTVATGTVDVYAGVSLG